MDTGGDGTYNLKELDITLPGTYDETGTTLTTSNWEIFVDECVREDRSGFACDVYAARIGKGYSVRTIGSGYAGESNAVVGEFYCWSVDPDIICPKLGARKREDLWLFQIVAHFPAICYNKYIHDPRGGRFYREPDLKNPFPNCVFLI